MHNLHFKYSLLAVAVGLSATAALYIHRSIPTAMMAPRQATSHAPGNMVRVPAGQFVAGTEDPDADEDSRPAQRKSLPEFYIDRTEVTNEEFRRYKPAYTFPEGEGRLPVTNVTYDEAAGYAKWDGKRLPTDEEWEKAARGTDGRRYPWGNQWDPKRIAKRAHRLSARRSEEANSCHDAPSRVQPVGSVSSGASPYGCLDMAGNAWEWVQGNYQGHQNQRILRGGAVGYGERACRTYARGVEGSGVT